MKIKTADKKPEKRKRGETYLDSIDLEILEFLDEPNFKRNSYGWSVLDIVKKINISHISLKPHIDKLLKIKLLCVVDMDDYFYDKKKGSDKKLIIKKGVGLSTIKARNEYWINNIADFEDGEYIEEAKQEIKDFKFIIKFLRNIRIHFWDREKEQYLDIDLRKTDTQEEFKKDSKRVTSKK